MQQTVGRKQVARTTDQDNNSEEQEKEKIQQWDSTQFYCLGC